MHRIDRSTRFQSATLHNRAMKRLCAGRRFLRLSSSGMTVIRKRLFRTKRALVFSALLTLPIAVQAANPIVGIWAAKRAWCAFADQIGARDPAPIQITESSIIDLGRSCTILQMAPLVEGKSWRITSRCAVEAQTYTASGVYMLSDDGHLHIFQDGYLVTFSRCRAPADRP
jgi:hypothetical protein